MNMEDMGQKAKSFWEKPEGKFGAIVLAGLLGGGAILFTRILPTLINLAQNTLYLVGMLALLGGIAYAVLDPRNRALAFYMYRGVMRKIAGLFIQLDPIAILKTYIETLRTSLEKMDQQIRKLKGTMAGVKRMMEENLAVAKESMAIASRAKETGKNAQMILKSRKAGRLQESNMSLQKLYTKMEVLYRVLSKMYENCGILLEDTEDQVKLKEAEWKAIQQSYSAMKSAMSIINGDKDKRAIYEDALSYIAEDLGNKIGEMERFMEMSQSFTDGVDLQNGVFEEKGLEMLEEWEKNADSWILGDDKKDLVQKANNENEVLDLNASATQRAPSSNQFKGLFEVEQPRKIIIPPQNKITN
jgi:DNA-binding FrmR family transcriptional regulator